MANTPKPLSMDEIFKGLGYTQNVYGRWFVQDWEFDVTDDVDQAKAHLIELVKSCHPKPTTIAGDKSTSLYSEGVIDGHRLGVLDYEHEIIKAIEGEEADD